MRGHQASAWIAWDGRDTVGTERSYRDAIAASPDSARPVLGLAQRQVAWGRTADAFATLGAFLVRQPDDISVRFQFGRLAAVSGEQLVEGERVLRGLIAGPDWDPSMERPSRAAVQIRLGSVLEQRGRATDSAARAPIP